MQITQSVCVSLLVRMSATYAEAEVEFDEGGSVSQAKARRLYSVPEPYIAGCMDDMDAHPYLHARPHVDFVDDAYRDNREWRRECTHAAGSSHALVAGCLPRCCRMRMAVLVNVLRSIMARSRCF